MLFNGGVCSMALFLAASFLIGHAASGRAPGSIGKARWSNEKAAGPVIAGERKLTPSRPAIPSWPSTPAARRLAEWVEVYNGGDFDELRRFCSRSLVHATRERGAPEKHALKWLDWRRKHGPFTIDSIIVAGQHEIIAQARSRDGAWWGIHVEVTSASGHLIKQLRHTHFGERRPSGEPAGPAH
jgi:hypothetical protein